MLRVLAWTTTGVLVAGSIYNVALALGAGTASVRRGVDPALTSLFDVASLLAMLAAFVLSLALVARPHRVVACFAPAVALNVLAFDFTYDPYFSPSLDRYIEHVGGTVHIYAGVVFALGVGVFAFFRPRAGAAVTALAIPIVVLATITYIGHCSLDRARHFVHVFVGERAAVEQEPA